MFLHRLTDFIEDTVPALRSKYIIDQLKITDIRADHQIIFRRILSQQLLHLHIKIFFIIESRKAVMCRKIALPPQIVDFFRTVLDVKKIAKWHVLLIKKRFTSNLQM